MPYFKLDFLGRLEVSFIVTGFNFFCLCLLMTYFPSVKITTLYGLFSFLSAAIVGVIVSYAPFRKNISNTIG